MFEKIVISSTLLTHFTNINVSIPAEGCQPSMIFLIIGLTPLFEWGRPTLGFSMVQMDKNL